MAQEQGRFSPAQILMAAEKAERDGQMDHAVQFYRYVAEQQSSSPEAELARRAVDRLIGVRAPHVNGFETPPPEHERTGQPSRYPASTGRPQGQFTPPPLYGGSEQSQPATGGWPPRGEGTYGQARMPVLVRLPVPKRGYRAGRVLAGLMTITGAIAIFAGIVLFAMSLLAPKELARLGPEVAAFIAIVGIGGSIGAIATGASLLLSGQLARAVFDGANAMRELVLIERAMARHNARAQTSDED